MIKDSSLYLVITEEYGNGRSVFEIAERAIAGGVDIIQMREKDKPREELIAPGKKLSQLCKDKGVVFIVNDEPSIAKVVGADGVHLGQEDMRKFSVEKARSILGPDKIIGVSTEAINQVENAMNNKDIDYIAYGPVFCTKVKDKCVGTGDIKKVMRISKKPLFFIGGITLSNVDELLKKGVKNIALIRAITQASDVKSATKSFRKKMEIASSRLRRSSQ